MSTANTKEFDAEQLTLFDAFIADNAEPINESISFVCECGSLKLGYKDPIFHSDWCAYKNSAQK